MFRKAIFAAALVVAAPALAQSEPAGEYAEVNGMRMYYEVSGEGEPIVVLPGAHMNIITMGKIIPLLAETRKVYALEFQGHGRTNDIDRPITYENLADDVAAFMDAVGLERADVFGYSMGAGAGLQLAIRHPDKVEHLVAASVSYSGLPGHDSKDVAGDVRPVRRAVEGSCAKSRWLRGVHRQDVRARA
jgi:pimeloyl-ACP methyl ester carboxylesterase